MPQKKSAKVHKRRQKQVVTSERGFSRFTYLFGIIVLGLIIGLAFFFKPWKALPFIGTQKPLTVIKPDLDFARARQLTIDPSRDTVMQIVTRENVRVTLEVPKGALNEKTLVKMIPFYYDKKATSPTAGVLLSPGKLRFSRPVTLSFNLTDSSFRNHAPKNIKSMTLRSTGTAQVLEIDAKATSYTPALIARGLETETYLPARILTGGAYVFSLDGDNQTQIATVALAVTSMPSLTVIEAATSLLFNNKSLSPDELTKAKNAVTKILSKKQPPALELYAALVLQKKIKNPRFSFIKQAYAYETGQGFYEATCRREGLGVEEYLGLAQAAQLMGYDSIGENCLRKAKNIIADDTKKILSNPNSDVKTIMIALQNVQLIGLDDDTNLDEQLTEKAKEVAVKDASKVAQDPNSTAVDAAKQLQRLEALGVESGPTYESLQNTLKTSTEKYDEPIDDPYDVEPTIDNEEILYNAAMSTLGVELLKAFGFEELDQESLKKKFDEMISQTSELNEAVYAMCLEMGGDDCDSKHSEAEGMIREAEAESYRVENEIGNLQSRPDEDPEYLENSGDVSLYFEEEATPTPEESGDERMMDSSSDGSDTSSSDSDVQQSEE